ncbi:hypothetical protein AAC387_Pa04g1623 [Persea americana]
MLDIFSAFPYETVNRENREENSDGSRKEQKESTFVNGFAARYVTDEGDDANIGDEATPAHTSRGEDDNADLLIFVARLGEKKASSEENVLTLETKEVCIWDGFF